VLSGENDVSLVDAAIMSRRGHATDLVREEMS
jgi:hypothetical protein